MPCIVNKHLQVFLVRKTTPDTFVTSRTKETKIMMSRKMKDNTPKEDNRTFRNESVVDVREWMNVMMLMLIPVLNILLLCRWASADVETMPASKVYWARAALLVFGAVLLATVLLSVLFWLITALRV